MWTSRISFPGPEKSYCSLCFPSFAPFIPEEVGARFFSVVVCNLSSLTLSLFLISSSSTRPSFFFYSSDSICLQKSLTTRNTERSSLHRKDRIDNRSIGQSSCLNHGEESHHRLCVIFAMLLSIYLALAALASRALSIPTISAKGSNFFASDGSQFYIKSEPAKLWQA